MSYRTAAGNHLPDKASFVPAWNVESNFNGAEGDRTPDLCLAKAALSQLSYSPFVPQHRAVAESATQAREAQRPRVGGAAIATK